MLENSERRTRTDTGELQFHRPHYLSDMRDPLEVVPDCTAEGKVNYHEVPQRLLSLIQKELQNGHLIWIVDGSHGTSAIVENVTETQNKSDAKDKKTAGAQLSRLEVHVTKRETHSRVVIDDEVLTDPQFYFDLFDARGDMHIGIKGKQGCGAIGLDIAGTTGARNPKSLVIGSSSIREATRSMTIPQYHADTDHTGEEVSNRLFTDKTTEYQVYESVDRVLFGRYDGSEDAYVFLNRQGQKEKKVFRSLSFSQGYRQKHSWYIASQ